MKSEENDQPEKQNTNGGQSRRAFIGAVGGIAGFALATAGVSEFLEAAAVTWPEDNPAFTGAPSLAFLQSGQPLTSAGLSSPIGTPATATAPSSAEVWAEDVPTYSNPNILMIIVDQLWNNLWLPNDANGNPSTAAIDTYTPNLQFLRDNSVRFLNYYVAACQCTPSRGAMFTGLYSHQTNLLTTQGHSDSPQLQQGFSTFGNALQDSIFGPGPNYNAASPYAGNVYYCGKWHMLQFGSAMSSSSLTPFGFKYGPIPNNLPAPSPDGIPNEGQQPTNHGYDCDNSTCATPGDGLYWGSDGDIATVARGQLDNLKTSTNPWCVVASFVNPHDIGVYPAYFSTPANGTGSWTANHFTPEYPYFAPNGSFLSLNPGGSPPYTQNPSHWNNADPLLNGMGGYNGKPTLQSTFEIKQDVHQQAVSGNDASGYGPWVDFFNNYVWLQSLVDAQIGVVRTKLAEFSLAAQQNTVIIFTTDHGDYCGSHTMHSKGGAVYEEAINVPLYVLLPQATSPVTYYPATTSFLCSAVDLFPLVVELATGNGAWRTKPKYRDLANRQSILYKISHPNSMETRAFTTGSPPVSVPYILHTTDEPFSPEYNPANSEAYAQTGGNPVQNHVACIRTKTSKFLTGYGQITQSSSGFPYAGKFAAYDYWPLCQNTPGTLATQYEFYDFTNVNSALGVINYTEIGNQAPQTSGGPGSPTYCPATSPTPTQALFCTLAGAVYGSSGSNGLFATELAAPLSGVATDGATSLSSLASQALNAVNTTGPTGYYDYLNQIYGGSKCGS